MLLLLLSIALINYVFEVTSNIDGDYRKLYKLLQKEQAQFRTFELKFERPLKVVLHGVPTEITTDEVEQDLKERKYQILKIFRMQGRNGLYLLVQIEISK